jgi:IS30 family transposase
VVIRPEGGTEDELPLNDADRIRIIEMYQDYVTVVEIADTFGVSRQAIHDVINRSGIPTHSEARAAEKAATEQDALIERLERIEQRLDAIEQAVRNRGDHTTTKGT